ncbi:hypothetical protein HHI36_014441 [Cryptolaemus montrouzieri]|uniref:Uncharacterized protein n=1 Tax=Cryptolaemus montrouzieri TaxID=559131 RepID=A0ABD2N2V6_9CUCU
MKNQYFEGDYFPMELTKTEIIHLFKERVGANGFRVPVYDFLKSFLSDWTKKLSGDMITLAPTKMKYGDPQGPVLRPGGIDCDDTSVIISSENERDISQRL